MVCPEDSPSERLEQASERYFHFGVNPGGDFRSWREL